MKVLIILQWIFLLYMLGLSLSYLLLNLISIVTITRYMRSHRLSDFLESFSDYELPISILVPTYNEESTVESTVRSLLQLSYSEFEVIVINDGSRDRTLSILHESFGLVKVPEAYQQRLPVKTIRGFYRSSYYPNLRVIDKENGGKSDALNSAINTCRYPLFCSVDADSILQRDSLKRVVQPFLENPLTVAVGGTIRISYSKWQYGRGRIPNESRPARQDAGSFSDYRILKGFSLRASGLVPAKRYTDNIWCFWAFSQGTGHRSWGLQY